MKKQNGFTLIELVVVIAILGILAAIALPKFVNMTSEARIAKMKGAVGAVNSGAALIHAKWLAMGSPAPTATGTKLAYEGGQLDVFDDMVHGYPKASSIDKVAGLGADDYTVSSGTISDKAKTTCSFTYTAPTTAGGAPVIDQANLVDTKC